MVSEKLFTALVAEFNRVLGDRLVGIYLHGSLAMGCFNPLSSDIDFLAVVNNEISKTEKKEIINFLLDMANKFPENGMEMSIVSQVVLADFKYPTPFVLHYSDDHKERYRQDKDYLCDDGEDPDLAAHFAVTISRGRCLYGQPIGDVLQPVPAQYFLASVMNDLDRVDEHILANPVYNILNLCRSLRYMRVGGIASKAEGGEWAQGTLPELYAQTVRKALITYKSHEAVSVDFDQDELIEFAQFMMSQIASEADRSSR